MHRTAFALPVFVWCALNAQEQTKQPQSPPAATAPKPATPESKPAGPATAGPGRPPIVIPASTDNAVVRLQLTLEAEPVAGDLEAGLLNNDQYPNQRIIPKVELQSKPVGKANTWEVVLKISGLIAFGDSTAPLLYKGKQVETLRFHKTGLIVKPPPDGAFLAREDQEMLLVLENPSEFEYKSVKARFRFQEFDVCALSADQFGGRPQPATSGDCTKADQWTEFTIPTHAHVSLRVRPQASWFRDPQTGFARGAKRKGMLTLRFQELGQATLFEQNLPLEVQFEPHALSLSGSLLRVAFWLIIGALLSLVLRVSIPNYRRKKALKDQLNEARKATREISDQVDSQLRVLLRVERLALDQLRREGWVMGPDFGEIAQRVEVGLATLKRKISYVQRLDAALCRRDTLLSEPVSPTRFDIIERNLAAASSALKSGQLSEQDWVFIQQRLEAADKALGEPTQEEKQAFEAMLVQRWKAIKDHFGLDQAKNELIVPNTLKSMEGCFPDDSLLPKENGDPDGTRWVNSIGAVRADLQLTALDLVREFQFLAPALTSKKWSDATELLTDWLGTPAIQNFGAARSLLLQLAEGISEQDIVDALQQQQARIELDPQIVNPNQTVRMGVRFRDPKLNGAAARGAIECEWHFQETMAAGLIKTPGFLKRFLNWLKSKDDSANEDAKPQEQKECGWKIHRYFEPDIAEQTIETYFFYKGKPVTMKSGAEPVKCTKVVSVQERSHHRKDKRERWLWRPLPQALQLLAALLVPLAALAFTTTGEGTSGRWWDLVGLGFGSETIRNILSGPQSQASSQRQAGQT